MPPEGVSRSRGVCNHRVNEDRWRSRLAARPPRIPHPDRDVAQPHFAAVFQSFQLASQTLPSLLMLPELIASYAPTYIPHQRPDLESTRFSLVIPNRNVSNHRLRCSATTQPDSGVRSASTRRRYANANPYHLSHQRFQRCSSRNNENSFNIQNRSRSWALASR